VVTAACEALPGDIPTIKHQGTQLRDNTLMQKTGKIAAMTLPQATKQP
jgi:hypothetical protein